MRFSMLLRILVGMCLALPFIPAASAEEEDVQISPDQIDDGGVRRHRVTSTYQAGETEIAVLLPREIGPDERLRTLYVLPVEAGKGQRWGNALAEVQKHDLPNRQRLICVYPTFSALPWYADHPTEPTIRQESYFLDVVVPFIERTYPASAAAEDRLLVGFSKSGYGAYSLLLRHPDRFGKAAAWDAPLMTPAPTKYGMAGIYGTPKNFEKYRVPKLLAENAEILRGAPRLILTGHGGFKAQHDAAHALLDELKIPHIYRAGPQRPHAWDSGWLPEAVQFLVETK